MSNDDEARVKDLQDLLQRLTGILEEASAVRAQLEQSLHESRLGVERITPRARVTRRVRNRSAKKR